MALKEPLAEFETVQQIDDANSWSTQKTLNALKRLQSRIVNLEAHVKQLEKALEDNGTI